MFKKLFGVNSFLEEGKMLDFMFNLNHVYLLLFVAAIVTLAVIFLRRLGDKGQRRVLFYSAILLIVLELGRMVYRVISHLYYYNTMEGFDWWGTWSFQMCATMTWLTAIGTLYCLRKKANEKAKDWLYNIMFGTALIGGLLTFMYPDLLHVDRPLLHFVNTQTVLTHILLIFLPIYIVATGRLKVRYKNIAKAFAGLAFAAALAMPASLISGQNFMFMLRFTIFEDMGIHIPFPWHLPMLGAVGLILQNLLYLPFEIKARLSKKSRRG